MKNTVATTATTAPTIQDFTDLVNQGGECWKKAGGILVALLDGGLSLDDVAEQCPRISVPTLTRFEQIGRGHLSYELLTCEYPAARYMARLSFSEQRRVLEGGIEVITIDGNRTEMLQVSAENLTPSQCRQVFDGNVIRGAGGQKSYITSKAQDARIMDPIDAVTNPYSVRGRRVVFNRGCELTAGQIIRILAEIEK